jgi:N-terminal acetyltransferase B complex catalytic subunit
MSTVRPMTALDLFKFNPCNLDHLTETYNVGFYLEYFSKWPHLCKVIERHDGQIEAYSSSPSQTYARYPYCNFTMSIKLTSSFFSATTVLAKTESSPNPAPVSPYAPGTSSDPNYLPWHGHITALTVSPLARRLGHASNLTTALERVCDAVDTWFVDLFVREENSDAQKMYRKLGYSVWRRVVGYYNDDADAFDMRKPLSRDKGRETVREGGEDIRVDPSKVW